MTEEEKEAVKYTENCLMKITMGIDCEFDVNILDALINIIKKLQKENEELKEENEYNKLLLELNNNFTIDKKTGNYKWNVIEIQEIKDKIEELKRFIYTGENAPQDFLQYRVKAKIQALQELLENKDVI